ncbi:hypothetical protein ILYODFUR_016630 [Ilyodon furcidens]|uniref:Uncharacterized protein n=1 Tax=Ilyodon furcidens TaxID=33524 RepID=A0ABV0USJ2_9TELE
MKRKVASVPRKRSSSSKPTKRGKQLSRRVSQATATPRDDNEDKWHSPGEPDIEAEAPTFTQRQPPGPRFDIIKSWSPLTLLKLFFSASTIWNIIKNTSSNAQRTISAGKKFLWSPNLFM